MSKVYYDEKCVMKSQVCLSEGGSAISDCLVIIGAYYYVNVITVLYVPCRVKYQLCVCTKTSVISSRPWLWRTMNLQSQRALPQHQLPWKPHSGRTELPWKPHSGRTAPIGLLASQYTGHD